MGNFVVLQFVWTIHRQQEENCLRESRLVVMGKERRRMIEDLSIVWFDPSSFVLFRFIPADTPVVSVWRDGPNLVRKSS